MISWFGRNKIRVKVGDIMTRNYSSIAPDKNLNECAKLMLTKKVGNLVVEEKKNILGIIAERDIIWAVVKKQDLSKIKVRQIMTKRVITISPSNDIYEAVNRMNGKHVKILPVVMNKRVVGVLTIKDILRVEPSLFELTTSSFDIREEKEKMKRKNLSSTGMGFVKEGICDECKEQDILYNMDGRLICDSCREMFK
jgi:CBS domain-containing protein